MQTFLPYPSFAESAHCLDRQRLGKQRVEALQLLRALRGDTRGWANHPAARMWRGHESALAFYGIIVCLEWRARGYRDTTLEKIVALTPFAKPVYPPWIGDEAFHRAHRSNLLRKAPKHYGGLPGFDVPADLPYVWPIVEGA